MLKVRVFRVALAPDEATPPPNEVETEQNALACVIKGELSTPMLGSEVGRFEEAVLPVRRHVAWQQQLGH